MTRAAAVAVLAIAAGCARVPPPDLSQDPALLLEQVRAAQERVTACRGSARLSVSSSDLSGSLDAWVAAEKGGRVRVEVFDFFGNPAAVLVAGGGRFALYDARAGALYRGDDSPENLARLVPVPIGARELASVICGSAPIIEGRAVLAQAGDGVLLLEIAGDSGRQVLAVGEGGAVRSVSFLPGARPGKPWKAAFSVFRHPAGRRFPTDVELQGGGAGLSLHWKDDLEVNRPPEPSLFQLDPPRGARVVDLAAGASPPPLDLPIHPTTPSRQ
ncbi:MAG: DUF4292 domain-containing protein [Deltaproteobacteria bacterium]|nr:DUF4292 domain-containing protein [Deltaproteobacteria bacterium]